MNRLRLYLTIQLISMSVLQADLQKVSEITGKAGDISSKVGGFIEQASSFAPVSAQKKASLNTVGSAIRETGSVTESMGRLLNDLDTKVIAQSTELIDILAHLSDKQKCSSEQACIARAFTKLPQILQPLIEGLIGKISATGTVTEAGVLLALVLMPDHIITSYAEKMGKTADDFFKTNPKLNQLRTQCKKLEQSIAQLGVNSQQMVDTFKTLASLLALAGVTDPAEQAELAKNPVTQEKIEITIPPAQNTEIADLANTPIDASTEAELFALLDEPGANIE